MTDTTNPPVKKRVRRPKKVASFPVRYLLAWKEATRRVVTLDTKDPTGSARISLRQKLNEFRRAMQFEGHEDADLLYSAEAVFDKQNPAILILRPTSSDATMKIFDEAGITEDLLGEGHSDENLSSEFDDILKGKD